MHQKIKKLPLDSQLQTYQILTNDVQMPILCLSYFITIVQLTDNANLVLRDDFETDFNEMTCTLFNPSLVAK